MSKKKSYAERLVALNEKAKDEISRLLRKHGLVKLAIPKGLVCVVSQQPGAGFVICPVTEVGFVRTQLSSGSPDCQEVLCFDYIGGIVWYENPVVWCQIADAVRKILHER